MKNGIFLRVDLLTAVPGYICLQNEALRVIEPLSFSAVIIELFVFVTRYGFGQNGVLHLFTFACFTRAQSPTVS